MSNPLWPYGLQPARLLCPREFSRQEYWSGLPCSPLGDLPYQGIEPASHTLAGGFFTTSVSWEAHVSRDDNWLIQWLNKIIKRSGSFRFVFYAVFGCQLYPRASCLQGHSIFQHFLTLHSWKKRGRQSGRCSKKNFLIHLSTDFSSCLISKNCFIYPEREMPLLWLRGQLGSTFWWILFFVIYRCDV